MVNIGTLVSAAIRPNNSLDPIATAYASEIKGGLHTVDTIFDRDNIIFERRDWGMLCYVVEDNKNYQLKYNHYSDDILDNMNWIEFTSGSGGSEWIDSVIDIIFEEPTNEIIGDRYLLGTKPTDILIGTWSSSLSPTMVVEWDGTSWQTTTPTDGMSVRVDNKDNAIYRYVGIYPTGEWSEERVSQIRSVDLDSTDGIDFNGQTEPFEWYRKDMMFLVKFSTTNTSTQINLLLNDLSSIQVKKPTSNGLVDFIANEIKSDVVYSLVYDGTYLQLIKNYSESGLSIKYYIEPTDYIVVPQYHQYWVYGNLTIDGFFLNYGQLIIANGSLILGSGTFSNYGTLMFIQLSETPSAVSEYSDFHAFGRVKTNSELRLGNENYKSGHNTLSNEIWIDAVPWAGNEIMAFENVDNNIVKLVGEISESLQKYPVHVYPLANSSYRTWFIDMGTPSFDVNGFYPSDNIVRHLISPVDVIHDYYITPSKGYQLQMFSRDGIVIPYDNAFYEVDYYSGFIIFRQGYTPIDINNNLGFTFDSTAFENSPNPISFINSDITGSIKVIAWYYGGKFLSDINYSNGLTYSNGILGVSYDDASIKLNTNGSLYVNGFSIYQTATPIATNGNDSPTNVFITSTPLKYSTVKVFINSQIQIFGTDYYFYDGLNIIDIDDITVGNEIYWNGINAGYELTEDDVILIVYES
jgi:hypothetical protein